MQGDANRCARRSLGSVERRVVAVGVVAVAIGGTAARADRLAGGQGVVPCAMAIAQTPRPDTDRRLMRLVLGRIWLPRPSTVIGLSPARPDVDRFGKRGLDVLAGPPIVLEVPPRQRRAYSLVFAPGVHVRRVSDGDFRLSVHSCAGALGRWNDYAGGYEVRRPICVPLDVRVGRRVATVRLSIGRRCP